MRGPNWRPGYFELKVEEEWRSKKRPLSASASRNCGHLADQDVCPHSLEPITHHDSGSAPVLTVYSEPHIPSCTPRFHLAPGDPATSWWPHVTKRLLRVTCIFVSFITVPQLMKVKRLRRMRVPQEKSNIKPVLACTY